MLEKESEILDAVDTRYRELQPLRTRWEKDYDLWKLTPFTLGKEEEYDNYTSNEPRTLVNKITELIGFAPMEVEFPLGKQNEEERRNLSNGERFAFGGINVANSRLNDTFQSTIQEQLAFYATLRGLTCKRVYIHNNDKKETILDIAVWDPMNVAWEVGDTSMSWVCNIYFISKNRAKEVYKIDISGKNAKLYDFWDGEKNAILIDKKFVKNEKHGLGHIPVQVLPVGGIPFLQSDRYPNSIEDTCPSVYSCNREQYKQWNTLMTYRKTTVRNGVFPPMIEKVKGGKKSKFQQSPFRSKAVATYDSEGNEGIAPMMTPTMPRDTDPMVAVVGNEIAKGGLSSVLYGLPEFGESGRQTRMITHAASTLIRPYETNVTMSLQWIIREMLTQYAKGGFEPLRLRGRDGSNEFFDVELSPENVKGDWFPEVRLSPELPESEMENMTLAQLAVGSEILSPETARAKYAGVKDTDLEEDKIIRAKARRMEFVIISEMARTMEEDGRPDLAMRVYEYAERMGMTIPRLGQEPPSPKQRGWEAKEPRFAQGLSRTMMPSEELGKEQ